MENQVVEKELLRPKSRYLGGVCQGIGNKYGFSPVWLRISFLIGSILFSLIGLIYLVLWFSMPNFKPVKNRRKLRVYQVIGGVFGVLAGAVGSFILIWFGFGAINSIVVLFTAATGSVIGGAFGFLTGGGIIEKQLSD